MGVAEDAEEGFPLLFDELRRTVRGLIQHEHARIRRGGHPAGDFRIEEGIAAEAEIDDLPIQAAGQDVRVSHPGTAGAAALKDAGPVHDDRTRPFRALQGRLLDDSPLRNTDFQVRNPVIQRQIDHELPHLRRHVLDDKRIGRRLLARPAAAGELPLSLVIEDVQVHAAVARRGHVVHIVLAQRGPAQADGGRVAAETDIEAGTVAAEPPDRLPGDAFQRGGQPLIARRCFRKDLSAEGQFRRIDIMVAFRPGGGFLGRSAPSEEQGGQKGQHSFHSI